MGWIQYMIIPIFTSLLGVLLLYLILLFRRFLQEANEKNLILPDTDKLKQYLPLTVKSGWKLDGVYNGVPLWKRTNKNRTAENGLIGCQALIQASTESVLEELLQLGIFASIDSSVDNIIIIPSAHGSSNNQKSIKSDCVEIYESYIPDFDPKDAYLCWKNSAGLKRSWSKNTGGFRLTLSPQNELHCSRFGFWISILGKDIEMTGRNESSGLSHLAIIAAPASTGYFHLKRLKGRITEQILGIREHMDSLSLQLILETMSIPDGIPYSSKKNKVLNKTSEKTQTTKIDQSGRSPQRGSPKFEKSPTPKRGSPHQSDQSVDSVDFKEKRIENRKEGFGVVEGPAEIRNLSSPEGSSRGSLNDEVIEDIVITKELEPYKEVIKEAIDNVLSFHNATDETPGWNYQGLTRGVEVYKLSGNSSCPWDGYKGTTDINLPLSYVVQYVLNLEYKKEWDDLFQGHTVIEDFDEASKVVRLEFKPVWPTSGRDFCCISISRILKGNMFVQAVKAVTHPQCPPVKGLVRAEILTGGMVIEELSSDPPCCRLNYLTRADLKGNLPARLVNKVTSAQPLYAANLREKIQDRYKRSDPPDDGGKLLSVVRSKNRVKESRKKLKAEKQEITTEINPDDNTDTIKSTSLIEEKLNSTPLVEENQPNMVTAAELPEMKLMDISQEEHGKILGNSDISGTPHKDFPVLTRSQQDNLYIPRMMSWEDDSMSESSYVGMDQSEFLDDTPGTSLAEQDFDLPRDLHGNVDFRTLANQAAGSLIEEVLLAERVKVTGDQVEKDNAKVDEWTFQGVRKNVMILRKIHSGQSIHRDIIGRYDLRSLGRIPLLVSFLGKGVIDVLPLTVWEAVKNPSTRFVYDNMLKTTNVVKELGENYKIIRMLHETTACFVKQARDFVLLQNSRAEEKRYVIAGVSIDTPECPPEKDCIRGKIISSGWIIEPLLRNGKACSQVTYLTQVNFGGRLPTRLINHIARRQPMAIAYLRQYLEAAENK